MGSELAEEPKRHDQMTFTSPLTLHCIRGICTLHFSSTSSSLPTVAHLCLHMIDMLVMRSLSGLM